MSTLLEGVPDLFQTAVKMAQDRHPGHQALGMTGWIIPNQDEARAPSQHSLTDLIRWSVGLHPLQLVGHDLGRGPIVEAVAESCVKKLPRDSTQHLLGAGDPELALH